MKVTLFASNFFFRVPKQTEYEFKKKNSSRIILHKKKKIVIVVERRDTKKIERLFYLLIKSHVQISFH